MVDNGLIANLKKLGLSENEAKAYTGLVFLGDAGVRDLHEFTKIPRAKLYEVLESLVNKRYAEVLHGSPIHYRSTDPDDLIQMLREDYEKTASEISQAFEEMDYHLLTDNGEEMALIQYLRSEWTVRRKMNELFDKTRKNIILFSRSPAVLKDIESDLISIQDRINILILVDDIEGYDNFSLPLMVYPQSVRPILKGLEVSHLTNQSCSIISDAGVSLAIRKENSKFEAHYISQPMVDFLYKTIYYFIQHADTIELPEELKIEYNAEFKTEFKKESDSTSSGPDNSPKGCGRDRIKTKIKEATENLKHGKTRK